MIMNRSTLWESISFSKKPHELEILDKLKTCPVFNDLHSKGLQEIRNLCHIRQYTENEHVFRAGDPGVGMYIILEGNIEIYRKEKQHNRVFATLEEGEFFGEIALLEELPRTASAKALSYCRLMGFFRPDLMSLYQRKPRLASVILMNMARLTARRLVHTNEALEKCQKHHHERETQMYDSTQTSIQADSELL